MNASERVIFNNDITRLRVDSDGISRAIPANDERLGEGPTISPAFVFELTVCFTQLFDAIDPLAAYHATTKSREELSEFDWYLAVPPLEDGELLLRGRSLAHR